MYLLQYLTLYQAFTLYTYNAYNAYNKIYLTSNI